MSACGWSDVSIVCGYMDVMFNNYFSIGRG